MTITPGIKKGLKKILEHGGGGEKGKPHSTSAGRIAAGARKFRRGAKKIASGAIEGTKKIAKPFVKEAVTLEKLKNRLKKKDKLSTWEKKQKHRKEVQKHGGNVIYADEWKKIDPGLKKGIGLKKGGRAGYQSGGRTRLLEELGRVEAEPSNRNRRAEISRVHGELNRGYKGGKRVKKGHGGSAAQQHYLQHGYGPHKLKMAKASDKAIKGNKLTKKA